ncbi:PAS domain-containing protein [Rhizobiales bacterium RZME27]|uniref:histidine kinase n=1 Tax=Endobacterium cereale TaxID=2663029 RepID=A0A6A8AE01_9HYPH|nr:PAS domain-containing protein [Endobacterium cereale]MEB2847494.1 PAS domain-containing protein [Endobacterium cereale]MQY48047.1 PAS domain-containing protein [Endobacterium cereale]
MDTLNSPPLIFVDVDNIVTGWSEGAQRLLGYAEADILGKSYGSLTGGDDRSFTAADGRAVQLVATSVPAPHGGAVITLRAADRLAMQEQLELTLANTDVIGSWDWDLQNDKVIADRRFAEMFGVDPRAAATGLPLEVFVFNIHAGDRDRVSAEIAHTVQTGEAFRSEYRVFDGDGSIRDVAARGRIIYDERGLKHRFPGMLFDITARRHAERAAVRSDGRYRSLFQTLDDGFCVIQMIWDKDGKPVDYIFLEVNDAFEKQTGILDGVGRRMREIAPDHEQHWFDLYGQVAKTQEKTAFENAAEALDKYYDVQAFPVDGVESGNVAILFTDRSEQKKTENALRASEAEFRTLSQSMLNHIWIASPDGRAMWFNDRVYEYLGVPDGSLTDSIRPFVHTDDLPSALAAWQVALASGQILQTEYRVRRKDGVYRWHVVRAVPVRDARGIIQRWIGSNTDIEHSKRNEEALASLNATLEEKIEERTRELIMSQKALQQAQKMETIGQLTGGVAHDFNNLLQVVAGNLQLLAKDVAGNERAQRRVNNAMAGVSRGAKLASQLLAFGRRQALEPKVINVGRFLNGMEDLLRRSIGESVEVEVISAGGLWNTYADPNQVENAVLNLAINARDAMQGTGKLTIEVGNASLDQDYARAHSEVEPGQYVMIAVTDTGSGMMPEIMEKVFEPFFSTKPEGKGTGLGLSMVYGFVKQSGGHVKIYSEVGHGTTVRVYLPRAVADEDREIVIHNGPIVGGTETVLVVEDDDEVRATVIETLADLGYRVLTARDAQAGLTVVESGIPIDVIFTDVVMPGPLKSSEMARRAKERLPHLVVLFTSGYTENSIVHGGKLDAGVELLSKPYTREALARRLRHLIANQKQQQLAAAPKVAAVSAQAANPASTYSLSPLTVLLVEDDALIRINTAEMLAELGHQVLEAGTAGEAMTALQRGGFDLLVTDLGLPDMNGHELAGKARELLPEIGIIYATGDTSVPDDIPGAVMLGKPYDEATLKAAVLKAVR